MKPPPPITIQSRSIFKFYLWFTTLALLATSIGLLLRLLSWLPFVPQEPTLIALVLPVGLFFALTVWMARWTLFHSTVKVAVNADGFFMKSLVANDSLRWQDVEAIHLQGTSGSEVQLAGKGHHVTLPSGSSAPPEMTLTLEDWIAYQLGDKELDYGSKHFWGP